MRAARLCKRCIIPVGGAVGVAWAVDEFYAHQVMQRTLRTLKTGAFLLWEYKVRWSPETSCEIHARVAASLVDCMKKNEGLYVKFGQAMSTMDVVLPDEYKKELKTLHDQAATFGFDEVRRVIESELGCSLEDVFAEFDETPIASASIAQVHKARLRSRTEDKTGRSLADRGLGEFVAVKVQKPNIPAQNACDLAVYNLVLRVLEYAFELPLAWTYDFTRKQLEAELDFRIEASNAERASQELSNTLHLRDRVVIPSVHRNLLSQRVMVMEWIDAIGAASDSEALKNAGLSAKDVMQTATEVFGYQIFSTGHVHCDPHPGNLLVRLAPEGTRAGWQLVLLDHGLYCNMSEKLRREYADFWVAAALGDREATRRICRSWGIADGSAAELFASLTQFRRVRFEAGRRGAVASLFGSAPAKARGVDATQPLAYQSGAAARRRPSPEEIAAAQAKLKERAKQVLADTSSFPQELFFVGRSLNIIRSANFSLGGAVNRVAILAESAAQGSALSGGALASLDARARRFALLRFRSQVQVLLLADRLVGLARLAQESMARLQRVAGEVCFGLAPLVLCVLGVKSGYFDRKIS
eukprot:TRINITY_DN21688_c0_g2_i1.p1 TRINITY_DN21688_c0_g2~~TRINITY_DN21688_c0_g2_i1.p1  ORF type:complete len:585 (+),score=111.00 TRINITY_DN21688_c0_g2_i1:39-1793(+)